jgi:3-hydroxyisobutyrate dehydrogenase-like beta-hydroxyacid dehydrogenase
MIAFLGTGLMGTGFVSAMLARGNDVTVWNRTISRAEPLAADGAHVAPTPAEAVRGADRIHLSLIDDAAVDEVLEAVVPALEPGATVIDHTTTGIQTTAERAQRLERLGVRFLHAPVFMGPANAYDSTGSMWVAGPTKIFEDVRVELEKMTGTVRYMGERLDLAAAYKLFGNMLLMFVASGVADIFALARAVGIDPKDAATVFDYFNAASQVTTRGIRMANGEYSPAAFELVAARKDVRLMLDSARAAHGELHVLPAIAARFDQVIAAGFGRDDLAAIAADIP